MAHSLGILTIAEGVETPDQLSRRTDLGCDVVHGYLFSRPVSARAAVDMVDISGHWTGYPTPAAPGCGPSTLSPEVTPHP